MNRAGLDLLEAAEEYGDALVAFEKKLKSWKPGDETPSNNIRDFQLNLTSAARKYATSTRKARKNPVFD